MVLGVLLGAAKWKQLHPTPTRLDLQERAYLRKAAKVEIWSPNYSGEIPANEFKESLNDFYLVEENVLESSCFSTDIRPFSLAVSSDHSDNVNKRMAMINFAPTGHYDMLNDFGWQRPRFARTLHRTTQRRLQKLIEKHLVAAK